MTRKRVQSKIIHLKQFILQFKNDRKNDLNYRSFFQSLIILKNDRLFAIT